VADIVSLRPVLVVLAGSTAAVLLWRNTAGATCYRSTHGVVGNFDTVEVGVRNQQGASACLHQEASVKGC
jgi:hypothetical protein